MLYKYRFGDMRKTAMCWGFPGDGWYDLIWDLSNDITDIDKNDWVVATQVKEKFGMLRFYYDILDIPKFDIFIWKLEWRLTKRFPKLLRPWVEFRKKFYKTFPERIEEIVYKYECKSAEICEECGVPGKLRGGYWVKTLCEDCYTRRDNG
jgi:hypothetical protein